MFAEPMCPRPGAYAADATSSRSSPRPAPQPSRESFLKYVATHPTVLTDRDFLAKHAAISGLCSVVDVNTRMCTGCCACVHGVYELSPELEKSAAAAAAGKPHKSPTPSAGLVPLPPIMRSPPTHATCGPCDDETPHPPSSSSSACSSASSSGYASSDEGGAPASPHPPHLGLLPPALTELEPSELALAELEVPNQPMDYYLAAADCWSTLLSEDDEDGW